MVLRAHVALIISQVCFGFGSVVAQLALHGRFNPLVFAAIRELVAGPILVAMAGRVVLRRRFALLGLAIAGNQILFIVGVKLANAVTGSIWQPTQPIMTAIIASSFEGERLDRRRLAGIGVAFGGCLVATLEPGSARADVLGNVCFFLNCLCTSCYVVYAKKATTRYRSIDVTANSYLFASCYSLLVALPFEWHVPAGAIPALAYWILFQSVLAYFLMTWASQFVTASEVSAYTLLQPVASALLARAVGIADLSPRDGIAAVFVFIGLLLVIGDGGGDTKRPHHHHQDPPLALLGIMSKEERSLEDAPHTGDEGSGLLLVVGQQKQLKDDDDDDDDDDSI
mmetsp:Transcript_27978/g.90216  ORF Transcript_27978/g.90216 Transcript_27978/m.90216 type:complete len:340 (+) Transcript_27978:154-1173(+)